MIFVTVGTQLPFDRLILAVNAWAANHAEEPVHAQIGPTALTPDHLCWQHFMLPAEVEALTRQARLVVAHAGMGSVLTALRYCRPLVLLPRRHALHEHRNDHQMATARHLDTLPGVHVAWDAEQLAALMDASVSNQAPDPLPRFAQERLLNSLRDYIAS